MTINYPSDLPQSFLVSGFEEAPQDTRIRTNMDAGPPQMRRRFTQPIRFITGSMYLTKAQVATFDIFYENTLNGGVSSFIWKHPRTGANTSFRFINRPSYASVTNDLYITSFTLEALP